MRTLNDLPIGKNTTVLVRAAMNVPLLHGAVASEYRLRRAATTLSALSARGARSVVISHIGEQGTETLEPVAHALKAFVPRLSFCPAPSGPTARDAVRSLLPGETVVLENLRRNRGEVGNDPSFAKELGSLGDCFVQDAFDTCHRAHASMVGVPKILPSYAGLVLESEIAELSRALQPKRPSIAIIGGAKFSTKESVLSLLLKKYDTVFVGGALANDFLRAQGHSIGASLSSPASSQDMGRIRTFLSHATLVLPIDVVVAHNPLRRETQRVTSVTNIHPDEYVTDIGPATAALVASLIEKSQTVLWNGPLGRYEDGFVEGTDHIAETIARCPVRSLVGGGDTLVTLESLGLLSHFSFVSTGGGAMLDFLAGETLPGIAALN